MSATSSTVLALGIVALVLLIGWLLSASNKLPLPPGPKGYPIIGNVLDLPKENEWLAYSHWQQTYGDLIYFSVLGKPFLIINSLKIAADLLEKRSAIYSGRMKFVFGGELCGFERGTIFQEGTGHRQARRVGHDLLTGAAMRQWDGLQEAEAHKTMNSLLDAPEDFVGHFRRNATSGIMRIVYGYEVEDDSDPYIRNGARALQLFSDGCQPGRWTVDVLPFLKHLPDWFPGAGFQKTARAWKVEIAKLFDDPFAMVKKQMKDGTARTSMTSQLLETANKEEEEIIKNATGSLYGGAVDTTPSALTSFVMAMVLYPLVQKKAQEELDRVVGRERLPMLSDMPNLPYIDALIREVLRWATIVPMGVPHRLIKDDEYNGFRLPKDIIILQNLWLMNRDAVTYGPDTHLFQPERFLGPNPAPRGLTTQNTQEFGSSAFGFGRRVCPGEHMAFRSMFILCASILSTLEITPHVDEEGKAVLPKVEYTSGVIVHPKPFLCNIKPRPPKAVGLIKAGI